MAGGRYDQALGHAERTRELGESLYADDVRRTATLVFNHGFVLGKLNRHGEAYPVLKKARKLLVEALGEGAKEMLNVELALLDSAPESRVRHYMEQALELVDAHHGNDGKLVGDITLKGGLRLWSKKPLPLLDEAAKAYKAASNEDGYALAQFWIGKKHFAAGEYKKVAKPLGAAVETLPEAHQLALMARAHLVEAYEELGQSERATEHCLAIGRTQRWTGNDDYQPLFKRPPKYPLEAIRRDWEGFVLVEFTVDEMGFVRNLEVVDSEGGALFHKPALEAAKGFRYAPKFEEGKPVSVDGIRNRIVFQMRP